MALALGVLITAVVAQPAGALQASQGLVAAKAVFEPGISGGERGFWLAEVTVAVDAQSDSSCLAMAFPGDFGNVDAPQGESLGFSGGGQQGFAQSFHWDLTGHWDATQWGHDKKGAPPGARAMHMQVRGATVDLGTCDNGAPDNPSSVTTNAVDVVVPPPPPASPTDDNDCPPRASAKRAAATMTEACPPKPTPSKKLRAVITGPSSATRVQFVRLDGSKSTGDITRYRWSYKLGPRCPQHASVTKGAGSTDPAVYIEILCTVKVSLTVEGKRGKPSSATQAVHVQPRPWRTPEHYEEREDVKLDSFASPPRPRARTTTFGENRCPDGTVKGLFCRVGSWDDTYGLDTVNDPHGPFDRWLYITDSSIRADRVGFISPWIVPNGPPPVAGQPNLYNYNMQWRAAHPRTRCCDIATALASDIRPHEGYGRPGVPFSGHQQLHRDALLAHDAHNDPRRYLETRVAPRGKTALRQSIAACLERLNHEDYRYGRDPLTPPHVELTAMFVWSAARARYRVLPLSPSPPAVARKLVLPKCANP